MCHIYIREVIEAICVMLDVKCEWGALVMSEGFRSSCILHPDLGLGLSKGCHFIKSNELFNHHSPTHVKKKGDIIGTHHRKQKTFSTTPIKHKEMKKQSCFGPLNIVYL